MPHVRIGFVITIKQDKICEACTLPELISCITEKELKEVCREGTYGRICKKQIEDRFHDCQVGH